MNLYKGGNHFITKKKGNYYLYDVNKLSFEDGFDYLSVRKDGHIILHSSCSVLEDWFADIGAVTHIERDAIDLGIIVFETNNLILANKKWEGFKNECNS